MKVFSIREFRLRISIQGYLSRRFLSWTIFIGKYLNTARHLFTVNGVSLQSMMSRYSQWRLVTVNQIFPVSATTLNVCMITTRRRRMSTFIFSHHGMLIMLKSSIPQSGHRLHTWHACTAQLAHSDQQQTRQPELNTHNHHRRWRPESNHYRRTESLHQQRWQEKAVASRWKKRSIKPCVIQ